MARDAGLLEKKCVPCSGRTPPLPRAEARRLLAQLPAGWRIRNGKRLVKEYGFKDFKQAFEFVKRVGDLAEREFHHPDVFLAWGKVELAIWTHAAGGLTENDFILAAKADRLLDRSARAVR